MGSDTKKRLSTHSGRERSFPLDPRRSSNQRLFGHSNPTHVTGSITQAISPIHFADRTRARWIGNVSVPCLRRQGCGAVVGEQRTILRQVVATTENWTLGSVPVEHDGNVISLGASADPLHVLVPVGVGLEQMVELSNECLRVRAVFVCGHVVHGHDASMLSRRRRVRTLRSAARLPASPWTGFWNDESTQLGQSCALSSFVQYAVAIPSVVLCTSTPL
ncbi:hypothetical protein [Curtobacterium sp. VKM Ac-2922]|uniref:hypothetical protein n=1 Tax=Curtobacterium sp. VKM Ac-2922 TaxID=2929475 RepID=UPI001FB2491F|nr:hypothetical protein [Curtobacterium sp. VKM Ac-2922]MCJ1712890.1 hypothetical protein [Curtobacterium sp. VKM Ac-2922]